jgi:hypothetical protein
MDGWTDGGTGVEMEGWVDRRRDGMDLMVEA